MTPSSKKPVKHIVLTSHPAASADKPIPIHWGAKTIEERGPVIGTVSDTSRRNCIGTHSGSYSVYRALAIAAGALDPAHRPDLTNTAPPQSIGPHPSWFEATRIVSMDPWGATVTEDFRELLTQGFNIQPTIAVTRAHINVSELVHAIENKELVPDGHVLNAVGDCVVTKAAVEPVWHLPGIATRFAIPESKLRRALFEHTGGMFPELITRHDLAVFLPPIGGQTLYFFGEMDRIAEPGSELTVRVHDECNGSDVFGSDICTCRPYLIQGIEECIKTAQRGGAGVIVYNRKEGRALGEVTKFLVYNARKRQVGGDRADAYFQRTECIAGVQDMRFQELMPDVLHWLGIKKIDRFVSMSDLKHDAIVRSGIKIIARVALPDERIPNDARVEMEAKRAAGYFSEKAAPTGQQLAAIKGRGLDE